jgi:hypothetical protein
LPIKKRHVGNYASVLLSILFQKEQSLMLVRKFVLLEFLQLLASYQGAEFVALFFSLALKSSLKNHPMTTFLIQNEG